VRPISNDEQAIYRFIITGKITLLRQLGRELDYGRQRGKVTFVPQHRSLPNQGCKVGFGMIAAALAALSMAVLGHFFI
jgi:hypothetical protein